MSGDRHTHLQMKRQGRSVTTLSTQHRVKGTAPGTNVMYHETQAPPAPVPIRWRRIESTAFHGHSGLPTRVCH